MKKILIFLLLFPSIAFAQKHTIAGYVEDQKSEERLIGALVYDADNTTYAAATNNYGFFSLTMPEGKHKIIVSLVGYAPLEVEIDLQKDTTVVFSLSSDIQVGEVVVTGHNNEVETSQMSRIEVPMKAIKTLPSFMGEVDIMKTLQLLPGVEGGTEGTSGVYVRGGGPDQNLILIDGVPVYNVNHLFGFFSVFNADAISGVSLYKGGFPARYGGRLSSVIDVTLKEGNMKEFHGNVSIGLISSKFTIEGPIRKNKTSFIVSARRTYVDVFLLPLEKYLQRNEDDMNFTIGYYFYDFNAKINHKFSNKDRLFFSVYGGQDKLHSKTEEFGENGDHSQGKMGLGWGNIISALRWNHVYNPKLFSNLTLTYSRFNFLTDMKMNTVEYDEGDTLTTDIGVSYTSGINDWAAKMDYDYIPSTTHKIKFGATGIYHTFHPGETSMKFATKDFDIDTVIGDKPLNAWEFAVYAEDDFSLTKKIKFNIGGRLSAFQVRDTLYLSPEPRFSGRFLFSDRFSFKISVAKMKQYLHFLTNNSLGMPTDLWLPATDIVVPQLSWQYATGFSFAVNDKINLVVEGFYKKMENLVELKEGESIFGDLRYGQAMGDIWESKVTQGQGWSYGGEFLVKKDVGKFTGWLAYTLSWSNRQFDEISFGRTFPFKYDRRHSLSIVAMYKLNDNWNFGVTFVYMSGTPITLTNYNYYPLNTIRALNMSNEENWFYDAASVEYFSERNNYRLPAYNRMDLSANWTKKVKLGQRTWSFGVYNVYNHFNVFYADLETFAEPGKPPQLALYSIIPVLPSISYKLEF